jgi:hypothetical protein
LDGTLLEKFGMNIMQTIPVHLGVTYISAINRINMAVMTTSKAGATLSQMNAESEVL